MSIDTPKPELCRLTARIVAAYVSRTPVPTAELAEVIRSVFAALGSVGTTPPSADVPPAPEPAVPIKKSVFPDHIVCLEDGMKLKMLKRHLRTKYGMTPGQYRQRWGLPDSYPMTAPNYAAHRSGLAKKAGLGRKPLAPAATEVTVRRVAEGVTGRRSGRKALAPA